MVDREHADAAPTKIATRLFRLRLRTLLLLVAVLAIPLGLHARQRYLASEQLAIGEAIRAEGGFYQYDYEMDEDWNSSERWFPLWLEQRVGRDYLASIDSVVIVQHKDVDKLLASSVSRLPKLRLLKLPACSVTDNGLLSLEGLGRLEWLELVATPTNDEGLKHIANIISIEILDLRQTNVTDSGIVHLKRMPRLKRVLLNGSKVTPEGIGWLGNEIPQCEIDTETTF